MSKSKQVAKADYKSRRKSKSKQMSNARGPSAQNARLRRSGIGFCWNVLQRARNWLLAVWRRPRDPVFRSLRMVKCYGGSSAVPERQWEQLERQSRALAKRGQTQQALTVLHCLLLLKPGSTAAQARVEHLTARQHRLLLNSKGISGTTRAYRKQQLDFYVQQEAVQVLQAVAKL